MNRHGAEIQGSLDLAQRFVAGYEPRPQVVLLAGSRTKGTSRPQSDYDLVFLYPSLPSGAWREMVSFEDANLEIFAHDLATLSYFCRELERPSGEPALARMIEEGIRVICESEVLEESAREIANETIKTGPVTLDKMSLDSRRYAITDLAAAIQSPLSSEQRIAIGASLYAALTSFALRANGNWFATGKALPSVLASARPGWAERFKDAFESFYITGQVHLLNCLIDEVLEPHGGRLRSGFRQQAPAEWRD